MSERHKTSTLEPLPMQVKMPPLSEVQTPEPAEPHPRELELRLLEPEIKSSYKDLVRKQVVDGFLPQKALKRLGLVDAVALQYEYDSSVNGVGGVYDHEYKSSRAGIEIKGDLEPNEVLYHYLVHELSHALSNETDKDFNITEQLVVLFGKFGRTVMEEAMTEHLTVAMLHGDVGVINPFERADGKVGDADYVLYRQFLDLLANGGAQKIDVRDFYNALYFGTMEERKTQENTAVTELINDLWEAFPGMNVLQEIKTVTKDSELVELMGKMEKVAGIFKPGNEPEQKKKSPLKKASALANRALSKTMLGL